MADDDLTPPEDKNLTPEQEADLDALIHEIVDTLFQEAKERVQQKTGKEVKLRYADQIKISMAAKGIEVAKRYSAHGQFEKIVEISNDTLPVLTKIFGEAALLKAVPARARDENVVRLLDKAGADAISGLVRKAMAPG